MARQSGATRLALGYACSLVVGGWLATSPAMAQAVELVETSRPEPAPVAQARLQVDGIGVGLSLAEVRALLAKKNAEAEVAFNETTLTIKRDGRVVASKPFVSEIDTGKGLDIALSAPTIGSRVIGITYSQSYVDVHGLSHNAPSLSELVSRLHGDFGPQSAPQPDADVTTSMIWNFSATRMVPCAGPTCSYAKPYAELSEIPRLAQDVERDRRLSVLVVIKPVSADPKIVSSYTVTIEDIANELLSLREAERQLNAGLASR